MPGPSLLPAAAAAAAGEMPSWPEGEGGIMKKITVVGLPPGESGG